MIYAAFLRGINVGGHTAPSAKLRNVFDQAGFTGVRTLLASGNVRFESAETDREAVKAAVETALREGLGFEVGVQLRTLEELRAMIAADPFQGIAVTPQTHLYVSFIPGSAKGELALPYSSSDGELQVLKRTETEVFGVVTLSAHTGTTDYMALLEKKFGKDITTRNWNTVTKLTDTAGGN